MIQFSIPVPTYCESNVTSLIDQPVNVISDLAFFVAGYLLVKKYWAKMNLELRFMTVLVFLNGIGSALWHAFPSTLTSVPDRVLPMTFIGFFVYLTVSYLSGNKWFGSVLGLAYWLLLVVLIYVLSSSPINGTIRHSLTAIVGSGLVVWLSIKVLELKWKAITAFSIYIGAIIFRIADAPLCKLVPIGTHWAWHLGSVVAMYLIVVLLFELKGIVSKQELAEKEPH